jgi:hypothetical protein
MLSPPVLNFGVQTVGITSASQPATLTNNTGATLVDLVITASGEYNETDNCGVTLANGASCTLNISMTPVTTGAITGTITITGSASSGDVAAGARPNVHALATGNPGDYSLGVVAVSATAIPPGIGLSMPTLSFSITSVGTPSSGQTITLQNTGTGLPLTGLSIGETNVADFPFTTTCPATLPAQATCSITVHFTPIALGLRTGIMNITANGGISAPLPESGTASAPVSQLAFKSPPAANVDWGGNAGSTIAVVEKDNTGSTITTAIDTVTLTVTGPKGYSAVYTATAVSGVANFNLCSTPLAAAGTYLYTAAVVTNSSIGPALARESVGQAASAVSISSNSNPSLLGSAITFTATVSTAGAPTGSVSFLDGSKTLGSSPLSSGMAVLTTSSLTAGPHSVTAVYSGDMNFVSAGSAVSPQTVIDFTLSATTVGGSGAAQPVPPGGSAAYSVAIAPNTGVSFPATTILTVTGLPSGATATLNTAPWTQLTSTSWQLPVNTTLADVSLTFSVPSQIASVSADRAPMRKLPPVLWGILLLPFAGRLRRAGKRLGRMASLLLLLAAGAAAMTGASGCGSNNGFFSQIEKTYTVTVTVTTGTLSHSTNLTLTVE